MAYLMMYPEDLARSGISYGDAAEYAKAVDDLIASILDGPDFIGSDLYGGQMKPKLLPAVADALRVAIEHRNGLLGAAAALPQWARLMDTADDTAASGLTGLAAQLPPRTAP